MREYYFGKFLQTEKHVIFQVRCWEVQQSGQTLPKAQQTHTGPVMDVAWSDVSPPISSYVIRHVYLLLTPYC